MAVMQHRLVQVDDPHADEGVDRVALVAWNGLVFTPAEDGMIKRMVYSDWRHLANGDGVDAGDPPYGELMDRYVHDGAFDGVMVLGDDADVHVVSTAEARRICEGPTAPLELDRADVEARIEDEGGGLSPAAASTSDDPDDDDSDEGDDGVGNEHPVDW